MIKIEDLDLILLNAGIETQKRNDILEEAQKVQEERKSDRQTTGPRSKFKYTILVRGPKELAETLVDGWVVKTALEQDDNELVERIRRATGRQNGAQQRRRNFLTTFADFFAFGKRKFTKVEDVAVQTVTKEPVRVVVLEKYNIDGSD